MLLVSRNLLGKRQGRLMNTGSVVNTLPVTGESLLYRGHGTCGTEFEINGQRNSGFET